MRFRVLLAFLVFFFGGINFASALAPLEPVYITITDQGFSPSKITVPKGTPVVWQNEGARPHWPASAVHPTHSVYPEKNSSDCLGSSFDACRGLEPGESWTFVFNQSGKWGFHDHLNPTFTGIVEVTGEKDAVLEKPSVVSRIITILTSPFRNLISWWKERTGNPGEAFGLRNISGDESLESYIRQAMNYCWKSGGKGSCYEAVAKILMRKHKLNEVMAVMGVAEQYPEVHNRCHEVTHYLAREAYKDNKSIPESYGMCTDACWGGCYHGVMEEYFFEKKFDLTGEDDEKIAKEMTTVCGTKDAYDEPGKFYECLHGLGHAMMFITNEDLPKSLKYCDMLGTLADVCYGGVFMENSSSSTNRDHPSKYIDPSQPLYPCTILEEKYLSTCYQYQSSYFSELAHYDWKKVSDLCETVPEPYQRNCFNMLGSNQVGFTQDYAVMRSNCALVPDKYHAECIQGAAGSIGVRFMEEPKRMLDFCTDVDQASQEACYLRAGQTEFSLRENSDSLKTFCDNIENELYKAACLSTITGN